MDIVINLRTIDTSQRGSYRKQDNFKKALAAMTSPTNPNGHEQMIDFVIANADITAPPEVDIKDYLFDYSADEINAMVKTILGGEDSVNPPNGAS